MPRQFLIAGGTVAITLVALTGVILLRAFDPNAADSPFPPCLFHAFTGLYCPGCGMTRALHALVHFDLLRALAMNAFAVISLPLLGLMSMQAASARRLVPFALDRLLHNGFLWLGTLVLFGVLRNLPGFEWLAPGGLL